MKFQALFHIVSLGFLSSAHGFSSSFDRPAFAVTMPNVPTSSTRLMKSKSSSDFASSTVDNLEKIFNQESAKTLELSDVESSLGMPWKSSIDSTVKDEELLYMPFWEWHMSFMKENLTNLRVQSCTDGKTDFSYNENTKKKSRIVSMCASSDEYRKIRMTYYDAGDNTQVYNAVCYPDPSYNLPVLGIDLLAFNRKKYLAIVDFQPIHENEADHAMKYEHILNPIKEKYDSLKGRMSSKFYDETQFFSQEMLFARFDDESIVKDDLFPAFKSYVETHLDLVRNIEPNNDESNFVLGRQKAYDMYSAERDPATGLFTAMFGEDWANDFVHNFLFSMSKEDETLQSSSATTTDGQLPRESSQTKKGLKREKMQTTIPSRQV